MGTEPRLEVREVQKTFGPTVAVDLVDLAPGDGEFLTILGPSGCGKTTLLRIVDGFERPDAGEVRMSGRLVSEGRRGILVPPEGRNLGMVFQSYAVWPHMTVTQNVAYPLVIRRWEAGRRRRRVAEVLELVDLGGLEDRLPHQLSGGQQQRVALARAIAPQPDLLLLDEPLSNLDAKLRERMRRDLRAIQRELGITTVLVTHDQAEAMELSDRILVMREGRPEQLGGPEDLYLRPANRFVADFLGKANLLEGRPVEGGWELPEGEVLPVAHPPTPGASCAVIRPEDLRLDPRGDGAVVGACIFSGPALQVTVRLGRTELLAVADRSLPVRPEQPVGLRALRVHYL